MLVRLVAAFMAVYGLALLLHAAGGFARAELGAYDWLLRSRPPAQADRRILIVDETEEDLQRFGHPLPDAVFVRALEILLRHRAEVIGVDKYRDLPVPPGTEELEALLAARENIVWAMQFGGTAAARVLPPLALRGSARVGFSDIPDDQDGVVRRGLLYLDDGKAVARSLPLAVAGHYLANRGIRLANVPGGKDAIRIGPSVLEPFEADDGGYAGADAAGFQILLDYRGMPQPFARITLGKLLDGEFDTALVAGRIAMIGASAHSLRDFFHTPYSSERDGRITGVEMQAQLVSQLVRLGLGESRPLRTVPQNGERAAMLAFAALGFAAFRLGAPGAILLLLVGGASAFGIAWAAMLRDWWWPPVAPAGVLAAAAVVAVAMRMAAERAERAAIMALFARHVSREVAELLWQRRAELMQAGGLKPAELSATILFADIRGYTPIAQSLPPEKLAAWLNEFMDAMSRQVMRRGGIVRQFAGDAIMAAFGAPIARNDARLVAEDARNAVQCALDMIEALDGLDRDWRARGLPAVDLRIGIHTGKVIACSVGTAERLEYALLGDVVNIASRLQTLDSEGESGHRILIGEATFVHLGDAFDTVAMGPLPLKGRSETLGAYRVLRRRTEENTA